MMLEKFKTITHRTKLTAKLWLGEKHIFSCELPGWLAIMLIIGLFSHDFFFMWMLGK